MFRRSLRGIGPISRAVCQNALRAKKLQSFSRNSQRLDSPAATIGGRHPASAQFYLARGGGGCPVHWAFAGNPKPQPPATRRMTPMQSDDQTSGVRQTHRMASRTYVLITATELACRELHDEWQLSERMITRSRWLVDDCRRSIARADDILRRPILQMRSR
jgi:hypothetical protein